MGKIVRCRTIYGGFVETPAENLIDRPAAYGLVGRGPELLLVMFPVVGQYSLPGGGREKGETLEETASREIIEETGVPVEVLELLHFQQEFFFHPFVGYCNSLSFFYLCRPLGDIAVPTVPDLPGGAPAWEDVSRPRTDLHMFIQPAVAKYLAHLQRQAP